MAHPEVHHLFHHPIADHSFSADHRMLAVAKESNVELHVRSGRGFELKDELRGHDKTVTGVDIAPRTGRIVTCSQGTLRKTVSSAATLTIHSNSRSQRLCLGTFSHRLETYARPLANKSCCHLCALVSIRDQVRGRLRSQAYCHLPFRGRRQLVGVQAPEETDPKHSDLRDMASELSSFGGRIDRRPRPRLFELH